MASEDALKRKQPPEGEGLDPAIVRFQTERAWQAGKVFRICDYCVRTGRCHECCAAPCSHCAGTGFIYYKEKEVHVESTGEYVYRQQFLDADMISPVESKAELRKFGQYICDVCDVRTCELRVCGNKPKYCSKTKWTPLTYVRRTRKVIMCVHMHGGKTNWQCSACVESERNHDEGWAGN
jgi:hypothetical protein